MNDRERTNVLGRYLRFLRKDKGVKQEDVAGAIGVTRATYSHYENGRITPPTSVLARLSSYYDAQLDKLVDFALEDKRAMSPRTEDEVSKDMDLEEITYYYQKMKDDDKQLIKLIIKDFYLKKVKG